MATQTSTPAMMVLEVRLHPSLKDYQEACSWLLSLVCCQDPGQTAVRLDAALPEVCQYQVHVSGSTSTARDEVIAGIVHYMIGRILRRVCVWCGTALAADERVAHGTCDLIDLYQRVHASYTTLVARVREWARREGRPDVIRELFAP